MSTSRPPQRLRPDAGPRAVPASDEPRTRAGEGGDDAEAGLGDDPLADSSLFDPLVETFYVPADTAAAAKPRRQRAKGRQPLKDGQSFRLVTFSFYEEDVRRLDTLLEEAKRLGRRRVSRSQIVRLALRQVDLGGLPDDI